MSGSRIATVLGKDLRLGPRSPVFLWVLVLPLLITLVLQVVFGRRRYAPGVVWRRLAS